jgi:hypothetical protein
MVSEPLATTAVDQVFFSVPHSHLRQRCGVEHTITIKGIDEADNLQSEVSWIAPIARALLKAREGDEVQLLTPGGLEKIEVIEVRYPAPARSNHRGLPPIGGAARRVVSGTGSAPRAAPPASAASCAAHRPDAGGRER